MERALQVPFEITVADIVYVMQRLARTFNFATDGTLRRDVLMVTSPLELCFSNKGSKASRLNSVRDDFVRIASRANDLISQGVRPLIIVPFLQQKYCLFVKPES